MLFRSLQDLAQQFGTPLYVTDLGVVQTQLARLQNAFPQCALRYAVKANAGHHLLEFLANEGVGAEVITEGELARALHAGMTGENILVGGPGQPTALRQAAREAGVHRVSLDGPQQWEAWEREGFGDARFFVRVNPRLDPNTHPHLATGAAHSKFGIPAAQADALASRVAAHGRLAGFHVHMGSMIPDASVHQDVLAILDELLHPHEGVRELNLGGGFAVPDFDLAGLADLVLPWAEARDLKLTLEPGRWLVADAGCLLTRVLWRKDISDDAPGSVTHWICDAGMAQLLRPALYEAEHPIRVVGTPSGAPASGDVDGPLCENADRLGRNRTLSADRGDLLVVERAGAYGLAMASNYASDLLPAEIIVHGETVTVSRERQNTSEWTARD